MILHPTKWPTRAKRVWSNRVNADTYVGLHLTVSFVVAAAALWLTSALVNAVLNNETIVRWDIAAAAWIHPRVTPAGWKFNLWMSEVGSPTSMGVLAVIGGLELLRRRQGTLLVTWIAAFAGGGALEKILKTVVHRSRPVFNVTAAEEQSLSFPSGHAMMCLLGVAMLVYVLTVPGQAKGASRRGLVAAAGLFVLLEGISRVYLGAHYPSDVIGGYAAAAGWVATCVGTHGIVKHRQNRRSAAKVTKPPNRSHASHARAGSR